MGIGSQGNVALLMLPMTNVKGVCSSWKPVVLNFSRMPSMIFWGFSFFYVKRVVQPGGMDTIPLKMVLNPWEDFDAVVLDSWKHCICNNYQAMIIKDGKAFCTCSQLFLNQKAVFNSCLDIAETILSSKKEQKWKQVARGIPVCDSRFDHRDAIMEGILEMKIQKMKARIVVELRVLKGRMIIHPGNASYWSCGLSAKLAKIMPPIQFPGEDVLSRIRE